MRVDSKRFGSTRLVKLKTRQWPCNDMILVKQEQVWEQISEDEKDDILLLSVESSDPRSYVESLFWLTLFNLWGCF